MDILFVHNNFPAQFGFIAEALAAQGHRCVALVAAGAREVAGVPNVSWTPTRGTGAGILPLAVRAEADMIRGQAAAAAASGLKAQGFAPQVIVGHPGWGETLFLRDVFPDARQILYGEFYYSSSGGDVGFDPEFDDLQFDQRLRVRAKNATGLLAYVEADHIVCPTHFQASRFPDLLQSKITTIHEGVNLETTRRQPGARLSLGGVRLDRSAPVVTFINRSFEPLRGYHIFMRALPKLLETVPEAHVLLIGKAAPGYGLPPPLGETWRDHFLAEVSPLLDHSRVHFVGSLPYERLMRVLSISAAHVYWTYPFVLSWSLLDAMACECLIVGSDTPPVRDAVVDGENGLLVDFFDVEKLSQTLIRACRAPQDFDQLRMAARKTVENRFDRRACLAQWTALIEQTARDASQAIKVAR